MNFLVSLFLVSISISKAFEVYSIEQVLRSNGWVWTINLDETSSVNASDQLLMSGFFSSPSPMSSLFNTSSNTPLNPINSTLPPLHNAAYTINRIPDGSLLLGGGFLDSAVRVHPNGTYTVIPYPTSGFAYQTTMNSTGLWMAGNWNTTIPSNRILYYNFTSGNFSALPLNSLDNDVTALLLNGTTLYVGGSFSNPSTRMTRLDLTTNMWLGMGNTISNGVVRVFAINGSTLYVGGSFTNAYPYIAKWDPAIGFSAIGNSTLDSSVYAFAVVQNNLFIGGAFVNPYPCLIRYDATTNVFLSVVTSSFNGAVYSLAYSPYTGSLYVGGNFVSPCEYSCRFYLNGPAPTTSVVPTESSNTDDNLVVSSSAINQTEMLTIISIVLGALLFIALILVIVFLVLCILAKRRSGGVSVRGSEIAYNTKPNNTINNNRAPSNELEVVSLPVHEAPVSDQQESFVQDNSFQSEPVVNTNQYSSVSKVLNSRGSSSFTVDLPKNQYAVLPRTQPVQQTEYANRQ